jgi:zinc transporter 1/2/3
MNTPSPAPSPDSPATPSRQESEKPTLFSPVVACSQKHGHVTDPHSALSRVLAAAMMEFGVAVHSIFIVLATGIVPDDELKTLLVALSFHQLFEGVALGARLSDARTLSSKVDYLLAVIFAVSAPLGIAAGIGAVGTINTGGPTYLALQGSFDAICAGVLLYLGFDLLIRDFAADVKRAEGSAYRRRLVPVMLAGLWVGGGVMALIGKYV